METSAVSATKPKTVRKNPEHTAATPSEPALSRGRSVKKRTIRGKINHGSMISVCSRMIRLTHHEVDEQPNKKPKKSNHSHKGRESDDKNTVAIVKIVPQVGCVSQDSETLDSQRRKLQEKPGAKSLGTNSKSTVHSVCATPRPYPGKGPPLGKNTSQTSSSGKSLRYEI